MHPCHYSLPVYDQLQPTLWCSYIGVQQTSSIIDQFPYDHDTARRMKLFRFRHLLNFEYV